MDVRRELGVEELVERVAIEGRVATEFVAGVVAVEGHVIDCLVIADLLQRTSLWEDSL